MQPRVKEAKGFLGKRAHPGSPLVVQQEPVEKWLVCGYLRVFVKRWKQEPGLFDARWCPGKEIRALLGVALPIS